jgi:quercetin dioxygenase-like cupin family protein
MSKLNQARYVRTETGPTYCGPGDQIRLLITSAESNGAVFFAEVLVPPGGGTPQHRHAHEDESFYLLEGEVTLQLGDKTIVAMGGDFVQIPRGVVHAFKSTGAVTAKMLVLNTPGGIEGFYSEGFDRTIDLSAPPPASPALMARMVAAAAKHGIEVLAPPQQH